MTTVTPASPDLLEAIVAATRRAVRDRRAACPLDRLRVAAARRRPRRALFERRLSRPGVVNVIAECKRRSPSRGILRRDYDPVAIARSYERAGAAAISVLTEPAFFDGALSHLERVREAVDLPVLRKDFVVDGYQVVEARAAGADALLLIVAALDDETLRHLLALAGDEGLAALVEVHDHVELDRALAAGATLVGVNNRNLRTLAVDVDTSHRLIDGVPDSVVAVAESGLRTAADLAALTRAGFDAFLVGERLVSEADPGTALAALLAPEER
jgi:indole-3-glycerol phosphate synthase